MAGLYFGSEEAMATFDCPAYAVRDLTKVYPRTKSPANNRISLDIAAGVIFGVLGPNGAGKTTFVRQLAGLLRPTSGSIRLLGQDVVSRPEIVPLHVAYYGQQVLALQAHRFREVLTMTGMLRGQPAGAARRQSDALLERFEAGDLADRFMWRLSGGERRLAALLAAFMANRPITILDEPTNDLDPRRRQMLWNYLHERNAGDRATFLVVSHNLPEVESVATQVVLIDRGELVASGTPGELKRLVADRVRIELRVRAHKPELEALLAAEPGARRLRPEVWAFYAEPGDVFQVSFVPLSYLAFVYFLWPDPNAVPFAVTGSLVTAVSMSGMLSLGQRLG